MSMDQRRAIASAVKPEKASEPDWEDLRRILGGKQPTNGQVTEVANPSDTIAVATGETAFSRPISASPTRR